MSYSAMVHEANVLATRVGQLEQAVPDTYVEMMAEAWILAGRVTSLESEVPPVTSRIQVGDFTLVGGWRVRQPFCRGGLAIDFATNRAWVGGHKQQNEVGEFVLPTMGIGIDSSQWPIIDRTKVIPQFWAGGYAGGLAYENGELVVSPRIQYDTSPGPLVVSRMNLATGVVSHVDPSLSKPGWGGGFIKGGAELMLGCGGYESGQGSKSGPTLAKMDGQVLLDKANHGTLDWNAREKRPPNYSVNSDSWVGLQPRNGEGRWCSDKVMGGGVWNTRGLCYWALLGTGLLDYSFQSECFASNGSIETWLYTYDPTTYDQVEFSRWPGGPIHGHEVGPDGRVYLLERDAWTSAAYQVDSVIKVYELTT